MEDELVMELCMRGYHVYSEATAGEELLCEWGQEHEGQ